MAYKHTSKKTGFNSRKTNTMNRNGSQTISNSVKTGNTTYTNTTKGGKSYTTQTTRSPDGYVTSKRITYSAPKNGKNANSGNGIGIILFVVVANLLGFS